LPISLPIIHNPFSTALDSPGEEFVFGQLLSMDWKFIPKTLQNGDQAINRIG